MSNLIETYNSRVYYDQLKEGDMIQVTGYRYEHLPVTRHLVIGQQYKVSSVVPCYAHELCRDNDNCPNERILIQVALPSSLLQTLFCHLCLYDICMADGRKIYRRERGD